MSPPLVWDYTADTLNGTIKWSDGVLEAPIAAALWGGQINLALEVQGGGLTPSFNLRGGYENLASGAIVAPLYGTAFMDAAISGGLSLSGRGANAADMVAALVGKVSLTAGEGRLALGEATAPIDFSRALAVVDIGGGVVSTQAADFVILPALSLLKEQTEASFRGGWNIATREFAANLSTPELDLIFSGDITAPKIENIIKEQQ